MRVQDIDSKQMRVFVRNSKRNKDRYTILSQQCFEFLRDYWRSFRQRHPEGLLFPGWRNLSSITSDAVNDALKKWLGVAGISRSVSIHSLPFVMLLLPISWKMALTSSQLRSFWNTAAYRLLPFIYIWKILEQTL